jgi:hypothetical protein
VGALQVGEVEKSQETKPESPLGRFRAAVVAFQETIKKPLRPSLDTTAVADGAQKLITKAQRAKK